MEERTKAGRPVTQDCDLVMRGGVTSGAVYPSALMEIAEHYQLRNVGGASAGAIAAVGAAACEYSRQVGNDPAAFSRLQQVIKQVKKPGFVRDLFQPNEDTRLAFEIGVPFADSSATYPRRIRRALKTVVRRRRRDVAKGAAAVLVWAIVLSVAALALVDRVPDAVGLTSLFVLALAALVGIVLVAAALILVRILLDLNRALAGTRRFGLCSGMTETGYPDESAVTDWLHSTIQRCAGLPLDQPLTFRMLEEDDAKNSVTLRLVTTDLSASRPVTLPLPEAKDRDGPPYFFEEGEFTRLFPRPVVERMKGSRPQTFTEEPGKAFYELPDRELPILVAARLSLSFPVLMETVPLWRQDGWKGELVRHTMSDGGISSNFPIHFFDALLPGRPTFGLDLQPRRAPNLKPVEMSDDLRRPLFTGVQDLPTFATQILNAARNWRDNMQAELPGFRDRICLIRLSSEEGGLNLEMPPHVVDRLVKRGARAGRRVVSTSSEEWWDKHRLTRYRMLMQMLQRGLGPDGAGRDCVYYAKEGTNCGRVPFCEQITAYANKTSTLPGVDPTWCSDAMAVSNAFIDKAMTLGKKGTIDFDADAPTPTPTMRIVPTV
jgi:predicted acylesterase/phospholipase RssA